VLSRSTWGAAVGVDDRFLVRLVRLPPVGDDGAVAVVAAVERADAVVLGVGGDRGLDAAVAHVVDGLLLPRLDLPAVDGQFARPEPQPERAEAAARVDGGELPVVAHQDDLGAGVVGVVEQRAELAGPEHRGLVDHQHRPAVQLEPTLAHVVEEPVDGAHV
jgi:hypothetical protein